MCCTEDIHSYEELKVNKKEWICSEPLELLYGSQELKIWYKRIKIPNILKNETV